MRRVCPVEEPGLNGGLSKKGQSRLKRLKNNGYVCGKRLKRDFLYVARTRLSETQARSRLGGHFYLSSESRDAPNNGAVLDNSTVVKCVSSSAAEAELGALCFNMRDAVPVRRAPEEVGHPQPPTPVVCGNSTAAGTANKTVGRRRSKAVGVRFYWAQGRVAQKQFIVCWGQGSDNLADCFTRHHPGRYHVEVRPVYLQ